MSECVVRMEMPKSCKNCHFRFHMYCGLAKKDIFPEYVLLENRPYWCPIICSLPEGHGRLGDLDALADDVRSLWDYKTVDGITATTVLNQTLTDIGNCPTIVPAERSE